MAVAALGCAAPAAHAAEQQAYAVALNYATPVVVSGVGDSVRFSNLDTLAEHDVASDTPGLFGSGLVAGGKSALVQGVDKLSAGSYAFHCSLHAWMKGTLVVGNSGVGLPPPPSGPNDRPNPIDLAPRAPIARLGPGDWPFYGHDISNSRNGGPDGPSYNEVPRLGPAWTFKSSDGDFTGTPVVAGGVLVAGSFGGSVYALDAQSGKLLWKHDFDLPINGSAAIDSGRVFIPLAQPSKPQLAALDLATGAVLWDTVLDAQKDADAFGSPIVYGGVVYQGTSAENGEVGDKDVAARGSVVALDAATGSVAWKTYAVPPGHDGGAVWSTPAIDPQLGRLFVGTGNAYHAPAADTTDSILALELTTGAIAAHTQATANDVWNATGNVAAGPDHDFGASPNLFKDAQGRLVVGEGQKAGVYWGFERATLKPLWSTTVGPGTPSVGGVIGSTAFDTRGVYGPSTQPGGIWSLASTGGYRWYSADGDPTHFGPVSVSNGVVYSADTAGFLNARDSVTGVVLAKLPLGSPSWGGIAIAGGQIFADTGNQGGVGWIVAYRGRDGNTEDQPGYAANPDGPQTSAAPRVRVRAVVARHGALMVRAACSERCRLSAAALLVIARARGAHATAGVERARAVRTPRVIRDADAGRVVTLRLRLPRTARRALAAHRRVVARISVVGVNSHGRADIVRRRLVLR